MTPTKITLEKTKTHINLKVSIPETLKGYTIIESIPYKNGDSIPTLRKHAAQYAKRFNIPFIDQTVQS